MKIVKAEEAHVEEALKLAIDEYKSEYLGVDCETVITAGLMNGSSDMKHI